MHKFLENLEEEQLAIALEFINREDEDNDINVFFRYLRSINFFVTHVDGEDKQAPDSKFNILVRNFLKEIYGIDEVEKSEGKKQYEPPDGAKFKLAAECLAQIIEQKRENEPKENETPFQVNQIYGSSGLVARSAATAAINSAEKVENKGGGHCGVYAILHGLRAIYPKGDGMPKDWPPAIKELVQGENDLTPEDAIKFRKAYVKYLENSHKAGSNDNTALQGAAWLEDIDFVNITEWLKITIKVVNELRADEVSDSFPISKDNFVSHCEISLLNQGEREDSELGGMYTRGYHYIALVPLKSKEELAKKTTSTAKPEKPNEAEEAEQTNKAAPSNPTAEIIPFPKKEAKLNEEAKPKEEAKPEAALVDNGTGKTHTAHVSGTDVASTVERKASVVPTELRQKETELPLRRISTPPSDTIFARHVQSISSDYSKDNVAANGFYAETTAASNIVWKDENQQQLATECATTTAVSRIELHMESNPVKAFEATLVSMNEMAQQVGGGEVTFTGITEDNYQQFIEAYNNFTERDASKYFKISFDSASQQVVNAHKPEFNALKLQECQEVMPHTQMHQQKLAQQAAEAAAKKVEPTPAAGVEATVTPGGDKPPKFKH